MVGAFAEMIDLNKSEAVQKLLCGASDLDLEAIENGGSWVSKLGNDAISEVFQSLPIEAKIVAYHWANHLCWLEDAYDVDYLE